MDKQAGYERFFKEAFALIRGRYENEHRGPSGAAAEVSSSLSADSLAALTKVSANLTPAKPENKLAEKVHALPNLSIDVYELQTEKRGTWTLVRYGWSLNTAPQIRFRGEARLSAVKRGHPVLKNVFNLDNEQFNQLKSLKLAGWGERFDFSDPYRAGWWVIFYPYFLLGKGRLEQYVAETGRELSEGLAPQVEPGKTKAINFEELYSLSPAQVETDFKPDPAMKLFPNLTPESLSQKAAEAILISPVPDEIQSVFQTARNAARFGYYYYPFFTVAIHYAALALESAIVARYNAELAKPEKVVLKGPQFERELAQPTHRRIEEISRTNNTLLKELTIQPREVAVKGKLFPHSRSLLSDWLAERRITSRWEVGEILKFALKMRNTLSHRQTETELLPEQALSFLKSSAYQINKIFHKIEAVHPPPTNPKKSQKSS